MKRFWALCGLFFLVTCSLCAQDTDDSSCKEDKKEEKADDKKDENKKEEKKDDDKKDDDKEEKKPDPSAIMIKEGNLSFPSSQQPSPLISLGQNILEAKQLEIQALSVYFNRECCDYLISIIPEMIYGFTDDCSLLILFPEVVRERQGSHHSSGPGDVVFQLEYAPYTKYYETYYDQLTLIGGVFIPTGSSHKNPPRGYGANAILLGSTFSRMEVNWFWFVSGGGVITGSAHGMEPGNIALYQWGFGRRICNTKEWLFAWQVEFDGTYTWRDRFKGVINPNSGGHTILMTPSLWISSYHLTLQLGVGIPLLRHDFGNQRNDRYTLGMLLGWTF